MKAGEIVDMAIEHSRSSVVIELPDGTQTASIKCDYGLNNKGEPVLIIYAGKKIKRPS